MGIASQDQSQCPWSWEHIADESPCPLAPPLWPSATYQGDHSDAANKAFKAYQSSLDVYKQWDANDASAMLVLVQSVEANIIHLLLQNAKQTWEHPQKHYQPVVNAIHYSLLQHLQALK